ncbi:hypothetical protein VTN00DRAFT_1963 [Thermoascus crustaceus]|uniref:uncharacterized protein n=1 Tax=Thermoascus crustaceus TaxID=5088 RepID=UPI00374384F6
MATDDAYLSFLDKANADLNAGRSAQTQTQSVGGFVRTETVDVDVRIPESLREVDTVYESETDEPFEPVALRWEGAVRGVWPGPSQFSTLISPSTDLSRSITTMSPNVFDPKDRYSTVMRAVRAAAASEAGDQINVDEAGIDVKVYRVEVGKSRVEYWVLALEAEGGKIVGMRARAVET